MPKKRKKKATRRYSRLCKVCGTKFKTTLDSKILCRKACKYVKYRNTVRGRANRMLYNARRRARAKGIPFSLTIEWLDTRLRAGICEVTGIPFHVTGGLSPWSPSLDRVDNRGGYTQDNVQMCVVTYNWAKGPFDRASVAAMSKALLAHIDSEEGSDA